MAGLGATVRDLGATDLGAKIAAVIPDRENYAAAGQSIAAAVRSRSYLDAAGYLPRAAVESLADVLGAGAAGLAGGAVAGPVGGAAGIGSYTAARTFGNNADDSAAAGGRATPNTDDLLHAGVLSAGEGALSAFLPGAVGAAGRGVGSVAGAGVRAVNGATKAIADIPPSTRLALYEMAAMQDRGPEGEQLTSPSGERWQTRSSPCSAARSSPAPGHITRDFQKREEPRPGVVPGWDGQWRP